MSHISHSNRSYSLDGKSVLITGGTGSFGQRFARTVLERHMPRRVVIYSRDELKQFEMQHIEPFRSHEDTMRFFIGDVRDGARLQKAMEGIDVAIHAAALKHVPACEYNPFEAVKTNILGAQNVIDAAQLGKPVMARAHFGTWLPTWHPWEDHRSSYAARRDLGGGARLTHIHEIDYLL